MRETIRWNENGWTLIQEADAVRHKLEIVCRAEYGVIVEVQIRHNDGNEQKGTVTKDGKNALPMPIKEFEKAFKNSELEFR